MSRLVVDASAAAAWLLPDETGLLALDAAGSVALDAPWLFWAELRNILIANERRGRLPAGAAESFLAAVDGIDIRLHTDPVETEVLGLARRHGLTVHDALYLELALRLGAGLATLDRPLERAARAAGVPGPV